MIKSCYATGRVIGRYEDIGGLVGENHLGSISDSFARGAVEGRSRVGGLAGLNSSVITYCYATGSVSNRFLQGGGLVGLNENGVVEESLWDLETSGRSNMCGSGCDDTGGKTTLEMRMISTFTSVGWDFAGETDNGTEDIWKMRCDGMSYPKLSWWQPEDADFICPDGVDFGDFSYLAHFWEADNCPDTNDCSQTDLDESGSIGPGDLVVFVCSWLADVE